MNRFLMLLPAFLVACGGAAAEGEACEVDDDCEDGLVCHIHDGEAEGECEAGEHDHEDSGMDM